MQNEQEEMLTAEIHPLLRSMAIVKKNGQFHRGIPLGIWTLLDISKEKFVFYRPEENKYNLIATVQEEYLLVLDHRTREILFMGNVGPVVVFSQFGSYALSTEEQRSVSSRSLRVWKVSKDTLSNPILRIEIEGNEEVYRFAVSDDGGFVAILFHKGTYDFFLRFWDVENKRRTTIAVDVSGDFRERIQLSFTSNGKCILAGNTTEYGKTFVWVFVCKGRDFELKKTIETTSAIGQFVVDLECSFSGSYIAVAGLSKVYIYNLDNNKSHTVLGRPFVYFLNETSVAVTEGGKGSRIGRFCSLFVFASLSLFVSPLFLSFSLCLSLSHFLSFFVSRCIFCICFLSSAFISYLCILSLCLSFSPPVLTPYSLLLPPLSLPQSSGT